MVYAGTGTNILLNQLIRPKIQKKTLPIHPRDLKDLAIANSMQGYQRSGYKRAGHESAHHHALPSPSNARLQVEGLSLQDYLQVAQT
jgi:hypothetical protein